MSLFFASSIAYAQNIVDVALNGLPDSIKAESILTALGNKQGSLYNKALEQGDRMTIAVQLQDVGYLEADVKSNTKFVPGGVNLTYIVNPHNLFTIDAVKATGLSPQEIQGILDELKITKETPYKREECERLSNALAVKMGVLPLFLGMERKMVSSKHEVTLVFTK